MIDDNRLQHLLDKVNELDVKVRLAADVPNTQGFTDEIEKLRLEAAAFEAKATALKRRITLSAMVDMNPDLPGGSLPPDEDDITEEEWPK